jgi:hypothetical protein
MSNYCINCDHCQEYVKYDVPYTCFIDKEDIEDPYRDIECDNYKPK